MSKRFHCKPCNKEFSAKHQLQRHLEQTSAHVKDAKHECHICHKLYMSKHGLGQHIRINHDKIKPKRRECPLCNKTYSDGKGLKEHLANVHEQGEKSHKCDFCGKTFMYVTDKNRHILTVHKKHKDIFCKFCSYGSASNRNMERHYINNHMFCMKCDKEFNDKDAFTNHMTDVHDRKDKSTQCKFCNKTLKSHIDVHYRAVHFYCSERCDQQFESKEEVLSHLDTYHPDEHEHYKHYMKKSYTCKFCDQKFKKSTELYIRHYRYNHHFCNECDIQLEDKKSLETHLREIHDENFKCSLCEKVFLEKSRLNEHIQKQHSEKPKLRKMFTCDICEKSLTTNANLKYHKDRMHFGGIKKTENVEKSFKCDMCEFSTKYKSSLEFHLKTHDKTVLSECDICHVKVKRLDLHKKRIHQDSDIPGSFKCSHCDYCGNKESDLRAHIQRVHSISQCHQCDICDKQFKNLLTLKSHIRLIHEVSNKSFKCDKCEYTSKSKQNFEQHQITHENRTYQCDKCEYQCRSEKSIKEHKRSHLPIDKQLKCSECPFVTHLNRLLETHQRQHLPEEEIKCPMCSYVTPFKQHMKDHSMTYHKDVIPCQYCDFKAMSIQAHRQHITKTHSKTTCDYCDFTSTTIAQARSHMKKCKNTEGRYICHVCEMQFSTILARSQHIKIDHKEVE